MAIRINNTSFKISNSSFRTISPLIILPIGQIFRIVNTGGTTDSLSYTKIDESSSSTGNITSGSITYILAVSGSLSDSTGVGSGGQLTVTNLLITSSVDETPTFTEEIITTTGAGTFTKPNGVTQVIVECWGAGGAGGGATDNPAAGAGGGGGQYARSLIIYSPEQSTKSYAVAVGGVGSTVAGTDGGDSTWETNIVIAKGGTGGTANGLNLTGVPGGIGNQAGSVGDVIYFGGDGEFGRVVTTTPVGGFGGAGAGSTGTATGDVAKAESGGQGGGQLAGVSSIGNAGSIYGGGGSGASANNNTNRAGGNGGQGLIRIIYR
jgi:hypothetical protein